MFFVEINPYSIGNISILSRNLSDNQMEQYYQRWIKHYNRVFKEEDSFQIVEWRIREWKAIKEMYASSILFCEAQKSYKYNCEASFFFSLYYSLFHAQLSCLCFDSSISLDELNKITHQKLGGIFENNFSSGKNSISQSKIPENFVALRKLREYYSYTLPLNSFGFNNELIELIKNQLTECFQITCIHSLFFERAFSKHGELLKIDNVDLMEHMDVKFRETLTRPLVGQDNIEPADRNVLMEIFQYGIGFQYIPLQLDHTFDELRTYSRFDTSEEDALAESEIYSFIFQSIM
ncbi:hypothetical protein ACI48J_03520 [Paenibacillus chitinolyticus]|uniref:hypothetical protein n=1 Tax=Paenibacillus chitinolyticus TaxID=79263 RepID=UPI00386D3629